MSFVYSHPFTGLANGLQTMQGGGAVGGWVELARTTLGGGADDIAVTSLDDKRYYMVLCHTIGTGGTNNIGMRMNSDTGSNYARRGSDRGGTDFTETSQTRIGVGTQTKELETWLVGYAANYSSSEKKWMSWATDDDGVAGAANVGRRLECVGKHAQTSNPINAFTLNNSGTGDFASGSEVVVLGWDEADTHTNNFWEELASASWSTGSTISSGTFTSKKYLWVQGWYKNAANTGYTQIRVGNTTVDTGTNYANRYSYDGGTDSTDTSNTVTYANVSNTDASGANGFFNSFIINNASNEKLIITHHVLRGASGAAAAPTRAEIVGKWANTSDQIDIIQMLRSANNFTAGQIKVWGAD